MAEQALLNPDIPAEGSPEAAAAEAARAAAATAAESGGDATERPDFIPEEAWTDKGFDEAKFIAHVRTKSRPASADAYELPEAIEGVDMEAAKTSPLLVGLRAAAHEAGLDQESFKSVATQMLSEGAKLASDAAAEEVKKLGDNANARISALNTWLGATLPAEQAKAVAAMATTAAAVVGLEALMNRGARQSQQQGGGGGGNAGRKSRQEIEAIMNTKAYMGKPNERDPKVIAEVDQWFQDEARINGRPQRKGAAAA